MVEQVLDSMDIERERGITIKAQTVRLNYRARDGKDYVLNLIDTPGHVDFAYEVNRSLAACEGSLLVVDASQGVEAQTLANVYQALDNNHEIVPVLNKVDLPAAEPDKVKQQIEDVIGLDASDAILISAKTGLDIPEVLEAIVTRLPPPKGDRDATLKALLVDSWYDVYLGVVVLVRIVDGVLKKGQRIRMMGTDAAYDVDRVGVFTPKLTPADELGPGEIGFLTGSIKEVADTRVGDTITDDRKPVSRGPARLPPGDPGGVLRTVSGRRRAVRGLARRDGQAAPQRRELQLRDGDRAALGFGFRCGFLGLLHLEIIQERLSREFNLDLIATAPSVIYKIKLRNGREIEIHNPVDMPDPMQIAGDPGALDRGHHPDARRISRLGAQALPGPPRHAEGAHLRRQPRDGEVRPAAERSGVRLLRPAEIGVEGLRLVRLSPDRLPPVRPGEDADPGQRRAGRRARHAGAPHPRREAAAAPWPRSSRS